MSELSNKKRAAELPDDSFQSPAKKPKSNQAAKLKQSNDTIDGLTLYEMHRKPRAPVEGDEPVTLVASPLLAEFKCPLCEGVLVKTMTAMECLHRFCNECISKYIRIGRKECPVCSVKLSSMRVLRPDASFDAMIQTIFPPSIRAMPISKREANVDRKIQLAHADEDRDDEFGGIDEEMSPRKVTPTKRGTTAKRGRPKMGPISPIIPPPSLSPPPPITIVQPAPPPQPTLQPAPLAVVDDIEHRALTAPIPTAVAPLPQAISKPTVVLDKSKGPRRGRPKKNPDADKIIVIVKNMDTGSKITSFPSYVGVPARTTVASLKSFISTALAQHDHISALDPGRISVFVTSSSGQREVFGDEFALGSIGSKSGEFLYEGYPVVYFSTTLGADLK